MSLPAAPAAGAGRLVVACAWSAALIVGVAYGIHATALVGYGWDWSPDEGLVLDWARRLLEDPASLYPRTSVPFPLAYTPLHTLLLAPIVAASAAPLAPARLLSCAWTLAIVVAAYRLLRRVARPHVSAAFAALSLAPMDQTFWYVLVRCDGLMLMLWLCSALVLLPSRLERGADSLSWPRAALGGACLLGSVLTKPTAILLGTPLVLGWFAVDRRSGLRLSGFLVLSGGIAVAALQALSGGGFLWTMGLWGIHPRVADRAVAVTLLFSRQNAEILVLALIGFAAAWRRGSRPWKDPILLLVLGGLTVLPALSKEGSWINYLLPFLSAVVVAAGRWWAAATLGLRTAAGGASLAASALAVWLALFRVFPVPTPEDDLTASAFYGFIVARGAPILATRPEYAYFLLRQPSEVEGSTFSRLAEAGVKGTETVLAKLQARAYRLLVVMPEYWPRGPLEQAADRNYRPIGNCVLGYFYGKTRFIVFAPVGEVVAFPSGQGARCGPLSGVRPTDPGPAKP